MNVVVDARLLRATGIGRYVTALVARVPRLDPGGRYTVLLRRADLATWEASAPNVAAVEADWPPYSWAEQVRLPRLLARLHPDLVHFPHVNVPVGYRGRRVVTIHDLTLVEHRNVRDDLVHRLVYPVKQRALRWTLRTAVTRADALITPTAHVRDAVLRRYPHVDPTRVTVTMEAVPPPPSTAARPVPDVGGPYLLHVGTFYPYKNLGLVVDALAALAASDVSLRLVLVGALDGFAERVRARAAAAGVGDRVLFTGFVDDDELAALYRGAAAFVLPSLSEGFGLPGLEAMTHGVPVAAARASCLPEVYGDAAAWFDPTDARDLAGTVRRLLTDAALRARLVDAGRRRVAALSWDRTASETLAVYRRAGDPGPVAGPAGAPTVVP